MEVEPHRQPPSRPPLQNSEANRMTEVVLDTQEEAEARQALDLVDHLAVHNGSPYLNQTTRWAVPRQRLDGKWAYPTCEHSDYTGLTVEAYNENNYPTQEE